MQVILIRWVLL